MQARKGDFSQGRVSGIIVRLGLPIMLAELVHVLYSIVDRMYIGHMAEGGTLALTGLGVCGPSSGGPTSGDRPIFPKRAGGAYAIGTNTTLVVSRGLARESTPLPRFFNHPELVIVDLKPQKQ